MEARNGFWNSLAAIARKTAFLKPRLAADYIDNPSPLSLFRCSCSAEQTSLAFSSLNRNVEKGDLFSFDARRLGNRIILAILGRWMIGPIVQLTADAAVLTYDYEVHRDGCIF